MTLRKGIGNPTSTLCNSKHSFDVVLSVSFVICSLRILTPSLVFKSHLCVKSISSVSFLLFSVIILIISELRILHIVSVDSRFLPAKIPISNILFSNVDFPAHVSPEIYKKIQKKKNAKKAK